MSLSLESFSTELLFELFEYLSPFELFQTFMNLNCRLDNIVRSYPLRLDFRSFSTFQRSIYLSPIGDSDRESNDPRRFTNIFFIFVDQKL
jgi:hypothetical protein